MTYPSETFRLTFPSSPSTSAALASLTALVCGGFHPLTLVLLPEDTSSEECFLKSEAFRRKDMTIADVESAPVEIATTG